MTPPPTCVHPRLLVISGIRTLFPQLKMMWNWLTLSLPLLTPLTPPPGSRHAAQDPRATRLLASPWLPRKTAVRRSRRMVGGTESGASAARDIKSECVCLGRKGRRLPSASPARWRTAALVTVMPLHTLHHRHRQHHLTTREGQPVCILQVLCPATQSH